MIFFVGQIPLFSREVSYVGESSGDFFWKTKKSDVPYYLYFFLVWTFVIGIYLKEGKPIQAFQEIYFILPFLNFRRYFQTVRCSWDLQLFF